MIVLTRLVTYTVDELGACASSIFCKSPRFDLLRSFVGHPHDRFPAHLFDVASSVAVQTSSESQPIFTQNRFKDAEVHQLYLSASTVRSTSSATLFPCNVTWRISLRVFRSGKSTRIRRGSLSQRRQQITIRRKFDSVELELSIVAGAGAKEYQ